MISVIIPLYHGIEYIKKQIRQIEEAARNTDEKIEVIFSNDDPDAPLPNDMWSDYVSIKALGTTENKGIQAARIAGLNAADGEYIHFLDQDDEIVPQYYRSQLEAIGGADAVYCRCYNGDRQSFNYDRVFETVMDKENIFGVCPLISPGQVLIKKESISPFWKKHILKNMGSDDYLLWLCMYAENKHFEINQDVLYTHVRHIDNFSEDILKIYNSTKEMSELLIDEGVFIGADEERIRLLPEIQLRRKIMPLMKDQVVLYILKSLLENEENGNTLGNYLLSRGFRRIAVYGAAIMGERIKGLLEGTDVIVDFFIDRNAPFVNEEVPVYQLYDAPLNIDCVIISIISNTDGIRKEIRNKYSIPVLTVREIVNDMSGSK